MSKKHGARGPLKKFWGSGGAQSKSTEKHEAGGRWKRVNIGGKWFSLRNSETQKKEPAIQGWVREKKSAKQTEKEQQLFKDRIEALKDLREKNKQKAKGSTYNPAAAKKTTLENHKMEYLTAGGFMGKKPYSYYESGDYATQDSFADLRKKLRKKGLDLNLTGDLEENQKKLEAAKLDLGKLHGYAENKFNWVAKKNNQSAIEYEGKARKIEHGWERVRKLLSGELIQGGLDPNDPTPEEKKLIKKLEESPMESQSQLAKYIKSLSTEKNRHVEPTYTQRMEELGNFVIPPVRKQMQSDVAAVSGDKSLRYGPERLMIEGKIPDKEKRLLSIPIGQQFGSTPKYNKEDQSWKATPEREKRFYREAWAKYTGKLETRKIPEESNPKEEVEKKILELRHKYKNEGRLVKIEENPWEETSRPRKSFSHTNLNPNERQMMSIDLANLKAKGETNPLSFKHIMNKYEEDAKKRIVEEDAHRPTIKVGKEGDLDKENPEDTLFSRRATQERISRETDRAKEADDELLREFERLKYAYGRSPQEVIKGLKEKASQNKTLILNTKKDLHRIQKEKKQSQKEREKIQVLMGKKLLEVRRMDYKRKQEEKQKPILTQLSNKLKRFKRFLMKPAPESIKRNRNFTEAERAEINKAITRMPGSLSN